MALKLPTNKENQPVRKLASIQRITNIQPIPGADNIVRADVLGWSVVVGKDEFKVGDLAVYFEIDSWLDSSNPAFDTPIFQPRFVNWGTKRGMRLKSIKLRKQLSQGLLMPVTAFGDTLFARALGEGDDVTELLGIEKWEPAEETQSNGPNKSAGSKPFPSFIQKTDQERVQNYMHVIPEHLDETFEVTIKLDGSSMTVYHVDATSPHFAHVAKDEEARKLRKMSGWGRFWYKIGRALGFTSAPNYFTGVCSRNIQLGIDEDNHFSKFAREHQMFEALENYARNIAVQGELLAPSIQGNYEQVKGFEYHVFDVFDIDDQRYLLPEEAREVVDALGWNYVPVLHDTFSLCSLLSGNPEETPRDLVDAILDLAEGPGKNPGVKREGIVFKSNKTPFSFKAISNSYLLKKEGK
jgi:RNA ligase (TIGR02306 family)